MKTDIAIAVPEGCYGRVGMWFHMFDDLPVTLFPGLKKMTWYSHCMLLSHGDTIPTKNISVDLFVSHWCLP